MYIKAEFTFYTEKDSHQCYLTLTFNNIKVDLTGDIIDKITQFFKNYIPYQYSDDTLDYYLCKRLGIHVLTTYNNSLVVELPFPNNRLTMINFYEPAYMEKLEKDLKKFVDKLDKKSELVTVTVSKELLEKLINGAKATVTVKEE